MKKLLIAFAGLLLLGGVVVSSASATQNKVDICHATGSNSNPYVSQSVNVSSLGDGHGNNGVNAGDIIPPTPGTDFPNGQNWNSNGQATYNNNCNIPSVTPTPTVTPEPVQDCDGDFNGSVPGSDPEECVTPTPTVTVTPTPTNTPSNGGGSTGGDGRSDGLGCGSHDCSQHTSASAPIQAVLGASTFAGTGTFTTTLMNFMLVLGTILFRAGIKSYAKENK